MSAPLFPGGAKLGESPWRQRQYQDWSSLPGTPLFPPGAAASGASRSEPDLARSREPADERRAKVETMADRGATEGERAAARHVLGRMK